MLKLLRLPQSPGKDYKDEVKVLSLHKDAALDSPNIKSRLQHIGTSSKTSGLLSIDEPSDFGQNSQRALEFPLGSYREVLPGGHLFRQDELLMVPSPWGTQSSAVQVNKGEKQISK